MKDNTARFAPVSRAAIKHSDSDCCPGGLRGVGHFGINRISISNFAVISRFFFLRFNTTLRSFSLENSREHWSRQIFLWRNKTILWMFPIDGAAMIKGKR
jgi:hypothetical protein